MLVNDGNAWRGAMLHDTREGLSSAMSGVAGSFGRIWSGRLTMIVGAVAAFDIVLMTLVTVTDVVGRYIFNAPLVGADEITVFALAICVFVGLPLVVMHGGLIRVEVLQHMLPRPFVRFMNAVMNLICGVFLIFCAWQLSKKAAGLASYGDSTMFLHLKTAPLAWRNSSVSCGAAPTLPKEKAS